jgi:CubicO group peptidase (beta-lactamase class C family)
LTAPYYERVNHLPIFLSDALHNLMHESFDDIFPAAALVIIQRERVVFSGAWGWIDPQTRQIPATPDAYFDLASVSKLFAATAFLTLVNEGRVRLDDALVSIVPEFGSSGLRGTDGGQDPFSKAMLPTAPHMEGRQVDPARVTFRHLLTHTSGLAPWRALYRITGVTPPPPNEPDPTPRAERWQKALRMICDSPFVDEPGKSIRYRFRIFTAWRIHCSITWHIT